MASGNEVALSSASGGAASVLQEGTKTAKEVQKLQKAMGFLHVLSIGVSTQSKKSGYKSMPQCKTDAEEIHGIFKTITQLNVENAYNKLCINPSKGNFMSAIDDLVSNADDKDRILLYFSGHGERIDENFYLVPQDAWASDDPSALIDFAVVKSKLSASQAKQKIVILDACFSGPDTTTIKKSKPLISKNFLEQALKNSTGTLVLTSSSESESSTTKSPSPSHSLYTYFLAKALKGDPDALDDDDLLTADSLHKYLFAKVVGFSKSYGNTQNPTKVESLMGLAFVFGDYSKVVSIESLDLSKMAQYITFKELERVKAKNIVPFDADLGDFTTMSEIVEYYLPKIYNAELGMKRASLRKALGLKWDDVPIDRATIAFPDGGFCITYVEEDEKNGTIINEITFEKPWFNKPDSIIAAIDQLQLRASEISIRVSKQIKLTKFADDLEANGWEIESFTADTLTATLSGGYTAVVEEREITFKGFSPAEILGAKKESIQAEIASNVCALITG